MGSEIYKILETIMQERNLSIPDVAKICGLSDSTVRAIIVRKSKTVALEVAFKLSKGLKVSAEYLNGETDYTVETYTPLEHLELLKAYRPSDEGYRIAMLFDKAGEDDKTIVRAALKKYESLVPENLMAGPQKPKHPKAPENPAPEVLIAARDGSGFERIKDEERAKLASDLIDEKPRSKYKLP